MSTLLPNYFLACVKVKKNRGLCPQTTAAAQSTALHATSYTNYPASIAIIQRLVIFPENYTIWMTSFYPNTLPPPPFGVRLEVKGNFVELWGTLLWGIFKMHSGIPQNSPKFLKYLLCRDNVFLSFTYVII